jgi:hypothetical protein
MIISSTTTIMEKHMAWAKLSQIKIPIDEKQHEHK